MTIFGPDTSQWQGDVSWAPVDQSMEFGWAKVSEGPGKGVIPASGYVSERWGPEKPEMAARAEASGFIPGGYLFLAEGDGKAQAEHFARAAGDMTGWAIAVDVEPREATGSHPTEAQARACVARLRVLYPGHPVGGYIPGWYWGARSTEFVSWLWASHYVQGSPGTPAEIYSQVPASWWAGYGGLPVSLLQFTDKALIPGVPGPCDCSAFRGTASQLRTLVLPKPAPAAAILKGDDMIPAYLPEGTEGHPVALAGAPRRLRFYATKPAVVRVSFPGKTGAATLILGYDAGAQGCPVPEGAQCAVANRVLAGESVTGQQGTGDGTEEISFILVP